MITPARMIFDLKELRRYLIDLDALAMLDNVVAALESHKVLARLSVSVQHRVYADGKFAGLCIPPFGFGDSSSDPNIKEVEVTIVEESNAER